MAEFNLFERTDKKTSKGSPIIFIISHEGEKYKVGTRQHCKPGAWKQEAQKIDGKKDVNASQINLRLDKAKIVLQEIFNATSPFSIEKIRELFDQYLDNPSSFDLGNAQETERVAEEKQVEGLSLKQLSREWNKRDWDRFNKQTEVGKQFFLWMEQLIQDNSDSWSSGYKKRFRTMRTKILDFEPNFEPHMLTSKWWKKFVTYCLNDLGNISNTINTDTKAFKVIIEELIKDGYALEKDLASEIEWGYIEPEVLPLKWEQILAIEKKDFSRHPSNTIRDSQIMSLISAFTGRRWEEVTTIGKANFYQKSGQWRYKNIGKGQKPIDIPLVPEAVKYFKKIGLIGGKFVMPTIANQTVNDDIKTICRLCGFGNEVLVITPINKSKVKRDLKEEWETVHFHTMRHSYGQHIAELSAGRPHAQKFISFMLGHASFQTSWKYMNRAQSSNDQMFDEVMELKQALKNAA